MVFCQHLNICFAIIAYTLYCSMVYLKKETEATLQISDARVYAYPKSYKNYLPYASYLYCASLHWLFDYCGISGRPQSTMW